MFRSSLADQSGSEVDKIEDQINLKVLFFGAARDAASGTDHLVIATRFPTTVGAVKDVVFAKYARLAPLEKCLMVAVNQSYATNDTVIRDLDEIAFLPPVSGG